MARTNNLTNFLTDVASAIKTKTGDSTAIPASQFDTKIANISTGHLDNTEYQEANDDLDDILEGSTQSYITNGESLFSNNVRLDQIDTVLSFCNNLTTTTRMFTSCSNLTQLDLTNILDASAIITMDYMFSGCSNLETLNLSTFKPKIVQNTASMFQNCSKLISLDLSNWDVSNLKNMGVMFANCSLLKDIDFTGWSLIKMRNNISNSFSNCPMLSNDTLNSILAILITANPTSSSFKTLKYTGLTQAQAEVCQTLSNYQAFLDAGWTTGY
jgi:surface protein